MDFVRLTHADITPEPGYSCEMFSLQLCKRKVSKGMMCCDYDPQEKSIEIEFENGEKRWASVSDLFGKVMGSITHIKVDDEKGDSYTPYVIAGGIVKKVKRTFYMHPLIRRDPDLPF